MIQKEVNLTQEDIDILFDAINMSRKFSHMFGEISVFDMKSHIEEVLIGIRNGNYKVIERKEE